jgi:hypothetical protein
MRAVALAKRVVMAAPPSAAQSHHAAARHQGVPVPVPGKSPPPATGGAGGSRPPAAAGGGSDRQPDGRILEAPNLRVFTFAELKAATRSFKPDTVLGEGGFGRVYKGWVDERTMGPARNDSGGLPVAVKKLNPESLQGAQEWQVRTPSVSFYLSLDSVKLHYPATNKKKRREYDVRFAWYSVSHSRRSATASTHAHDAWYIQSTARACIILNCCVAVNFVFVFFFKKKSWISNHRQMVPHVRTTSAPTKKLSSS